MGCLGTLMDGLAAIGVIVFVLGLALAGAITAQAAGLVLLALVALIAVARARGSSVAATALRIGLPIEGLLVLARYSGGSVQQLLFALLPLVVVLGAVYLMFRAVFGKKK